MGHDGIIASVKLLTCLAFDSAVMRQVLDRHKLTSRKELIRVSKQLTSWLTAGKEVLQKLPPS
jgi:hypothetical protein